jgi:cellulose synthase/poly-beta-1,6-N-acetylglucosamine synthase-like glycosyltransferase
MSAQSAANVAYENRSASPREDATSPLWHLRAAQILLDRGLLRAGDFGGAIADELAWRSDLGSVLIGKGLVRPHDFYHALAEAQALPFIDLLEEPPDPELLFEEDRTNYSALKLIPWRLVDGHWLVATVDTGEAQRQWAERRFGKDFSFVITSPFDIFWAQREHFRDYDNLRAREGLLEWKPEHSAKVTFTKSLKIGFGVAAALYLLFLIAAPAACLIATMAVLTVIYTVTFGFKAALTWLGASRKVDMNITDGAVAELTDAELPVYTVLVPMYREAKVLPLLFDALKKLDYPASKLEVKLVLEEDDQETIDAAKALRPPGTFEIVRVPPSYPKTKPKACNYALFFARGEFVTIYDAEDQPEPDQLKKAVIAFRTGDPRLACVQARLNYFNRSENWLTRMFTLEYSQWFDFLLPGLDKLKMPIPLGGTSNHFRLQALRKVRAWDPYNVTEDADLGIRLAQEGFTIGVINSTTYEEANGVVGSWIKQRSRWIKGYMQTWLVHMRHPIDLWRKVGWRGTFSFHFFIGAPPFLNLVNPFMWAITIAFYLLGDGEFGWLFPEPIGTLATFNLFFANLLLIYFGIVAALKRRYLDLVPTGLVQPLYWVLHAIAAYKALWQLLARPHYWEKTEHGTSSITDKKLALVRKEAA